MGRFTDRLAGKKKSPKAKAIEDALNTALGYGDDLIKNGATENGNCYEVAALTILHLDATTPERATDVRLVHGRPTRRLAPFESYGHAWVEIRSDQHRHMAEDDFTLCADLANGRNLRMTRMEYYGLGLINRHECFYYTAEEARELLVEYGHYGPWEGPEACAAVHEEGNDDGET